MSIKISEIEEIFNEVFEEEKGLVNSVDTVYETPEEHSDFIQRTLGRSEIKLRS